LTGDLLVGRDYEQVPQVSLPHGVNKRPESVDRQRWLAAIHESDWHDEAFYSGIGRIAGYGCPASVGSLATVADALLDYYDLGVRMFGIGLPTESGEDRELAVELFRLLRAGADRRDHEQVGGAGSLRAGLRDQATVPEPKVSTATLTPPLRKCSR
jgi:hypothetical protein